MKDVKTLVEEIQKNGKQLSLMGYSLSTLYRYAKAVNKFLEEDNRNWRVKVSYKDKSLLVIQQKSPRIASFTNLFIGYNQEEDFFVAICADDEDEADEVAENYRRDSKLGGKFTILQPTGSLDEYRFDCDVILYPAG